MKVKEIAKKIHEHLKRIEADPQLNQGRVGTTLSSGRFLYHSSAIDSGRYVQVRYLSYQAPINLAKLQAERYLAWLEAGNVGSHKEALKESEGEG